MLTETALEAVVESVITWRVAGWTGFGFAERDGIREGLVCVIICVKLCHTFSVGLNAKLKQPERSCTRPGRQAHLLPVE